MFMIIGLKENVPYVVKAAPVTFINSELLKDELLNCLQLLITGGFNVRAVILTTMQLMFQHLQN